MIKFNEMIKIADIHEKRIRTAIDRVKHLFPIKESMIENLLDDELVWIDLLINRFGKLQDILGAKIIDLFLEKQEEDTQNLTMLDKINKLERLGLIENTQIWREMRELRNHISHEYPDAPALTARYLNQIFDMTSGLLDIFARIKNY